MKALVAVDIRTVSKTELVDVGTVNIENGLNTKPGIVDYLDKIKNPYCYLDHGMIVKISFSGKRKLEECIVTAVSI